LNKESGAEKEEGAFLLLVVLAELFVEIKNIFVQRARRRVASSLLAQANVVPEDALMLLRNL
jgi:hypothetical protein